MQSKYAVSSFAGLVKAPRGGIGKDDESTKMAVQCYFGAALLKYDSYGL